MELKWNKPVLVGVLCWANAFLFAAPPSGDKFEISTTEVVHRSQVVELNYEVPAPGMVEIALFNDAGEEVWYNHYSVDRGGHRIALKRSAFRPGMVYTYELRFKESVRRGSISGQP